MIRKVLQITPTTLAITLPKKWTNSHGVKRGDEVALDVNNAGSLIVNSQESTVQREITVNLHGFDMHMLRSHISALYCAGYSLIHAKFPNQKTFRNLQLIVDSFYGFDIFDVKQNECSMRAVFDIKTKELMRHVQKQIYVARSMFEVFVEHKNNKEPLDEKMLLSMRVSSLKERNLIVRSATLHNLPSAASYAVVANNLFEICRSLHLLCVAAGNQNVDDKNKTLAMTFDLYKLCAIDHTDRVGNDFYQKEEKLSKQITELLLKNQAALVCSYCQHIIEQIRSLYFTLETFEAQSVPN